MGAFLKTVIGGAAGLAALYFVAKVAYNAGQEVARAECHYEEVRNQTEAIEQKKAEIPDTEKTEVVHEKTVENNMVSVPEQKKPGKLKMLMGIGKLIRKKDSVIGNLIHNPENHKIEAYVLGDGLRINVMPKTA